MRIGWVMASVAALASSAAAAERGLPPMAIYEPVDYGAHSQNWDLAQSNDGVIHVGNGIGVLQFDGTRWRVFETPHRTRVRRLLVDDPPRALVATTDALLQLNLDDGSQRELSADWPASTRQFGEAMGLVRTSIGTFLQGNQQIVRVATDGSLDVFTSAGGFQQSFAVGDTFYTLDRALGLRTAMDNPTDDRATLSTVEGGAQFVGDQLGFVVARGPDRLLMGSRLRGLVHFQGGQLAPWPNALVDWMHAQIVMPGIVMRDDSVVVGTLRGGLAWMGADGGSRLRLGAADGLPSDSVYGLLQDRQGSLWAATDGGVARIDLDHPVSVYDRRQALSTVWGVTRHRGRMVLATRLGLRVAVPEAADRPLTWAAVAGHPTQAWDVQSIDGALWVAGSDGVYVIRNSEQPLAQWQTERVVGTRFAYRLLPLAGRVMAATDQGIVAIATDGSSQLLAGYHGESRQLTLADDGTLWAGTPNGRLLRLAAAGDALEVFDAKHGIPAGMVWPLATTEGLLLGTRDGVRRFDPASQRLFGSDSRLPKCAVTRLAAFADMLWGACSEHLFRRRLGEPVVPAAPALNSDPAPWLAFPNEFVYALHGDTDGSVWVGRERSLLRIEAAAAAHSEAPANEPPLLPPLIRAVVEQTPQGLRALPWSPTPNRTGSAILWPQGLRNLRVDYAWPDYGRLQQAQFSTLLEGSDADWIPGSSDARREFSHLPGGSYRLHVRVQLPNGASSASQLDFAIASPWYRGAWALVGGGLLAVSAAIGLGLLLGRWRSRAVSAHNRRLQLEVDARTQQLSLQAERLQALDVAKSRLFAAITHDFRTPLTLILDPARELLRGLWGALPAAAQRELLRITRNAEQLDRLLDRLLDLRVLENGQQPLQLQVLDLASLAYETCSHFAGLAEQREVRLRVNADAPGPSVLIDYSGMQTVLFNLLGNAFKHATAAGEIELDVSIESSGHACLSVRDNGPGFAAAELPHLFDHYFRGEQASRQRRPGSGLGLALCRELIERMGGTLSLQNAAQGGAEVSLRLPISELPAQPAVVAADVVSAPGGELDTFGAGDSSLHAAVGRAEDADTTTVLVVDDNAELRAFISERLRERYRIIEAGDGVAALALAQVALPDLIVSDVHMPQMDGLELTRRIKADIETKMIPVILLASRGSLPERIAGFDMGADDFLVKPFHASELLARVAALIGSRRQLRSILAERAAARGDAATELAITPPVSTAVLSKPDFGQRLHAVIAAHLHDSAFGVTELAQSLHMDRSTLFKRTAQLDLPPPVQLIRHARLQQAREMLQRGDGHVGEIAYACGFESLSYFSRVFKERFGIAPSAVRG